MRNSARATPPFGNPKPMQKETPAKRNSAIDRSQNKGHGMPPPSNRKLTQSEKPTKRNAPDKNPTNARAMPLKPRKNLTGAP
jgi:hypothetical protein